MRIEIVKKKSSTWLIALCLLWAGMVVPLGMAQSHDDDVIHRRASELVARMTVEEKVGQLNQVSGQSNPSSTDNRLDRAIEQGQVGSVLWLVDVKEINRLQHLAVEKTRQRIPLLVDYGVVHGRQTMFPVPLAVASSWDPIEACISVRLKRALEVLQMLPRMFTPPILRVCEPDGRCGVFSSRPVLAHIRPEPAGAGLAVARRKYRNRRVVGMEQRRYQLTGSANPASQRGAFALDALAGIDL
jgi:hypothetical protein